MGGDDGAREARVAEARRAAGKTGQYLLYSVCQLMVAIDAGEYGFTEYSG